MCIMNYRSVGVMMMLIIMLSQSDERMEKLEDVAIGVLEELTDSCSDCGITNDIQSFSCFPESPTYVTYRARLGGTSETDSGSLISLIEEWVSGGANIIVTGVLMTVDSECSVAISSLSEGGCLASDSSASSCSDTGAIIAGVVVIILIIAITIIIVAVVTLMIVKHRYRGPLIKK